MPSILFYYTTFLYILVQSKPEMFLVMTQPAIVHLCPDSKMMICSLESAVAYQMYSEVGEFILNLKYIFHGTYTISAYYFPGASCSKLTTSLVNVSLKFKT